MNYSRLNNKIRVRSEDIITYELRCQTPIMDKYFTFDAPVLSSDNDLINYAMVQNKDFRYIVYANQYEHLDLSYRVL